MPNNLSTKSLLIIAFLVVLSLGLGSYIGSSISPSSDLQIIQLTEANTRLTSENDALKKAVPSITGKTVKIGYVASNTALLQSTKPFFEQIIQPDLNSYAKNFGLDTSFEFVYEDAQGQAAIALDKIQELRSKGIKIVIGLEWSTQICASLSYVNINKILLMSSSSTSPSCALANDMLFRMCPSDGNMPLVLAKTIWSYGIKELVIISRGDSYGDGVVNIIIPFFDEVGVRVANPRVRYETNTTDFNDYLQLANAQVGEAIKRQGGDTSRVGILLLSFDEAPFLLKQANQYQPLYDVIWFGSDRTVNSQVIMKDASEEVSHVKLLSLLAQKPASLKYAELGNRYATFANDEFTIYRAYLYDAAWVVAKSILETGSDDVSKVAAVLPKVSEGYFGASGWCRLNEFGDRVPASYDVWMYAPGAGKPCECFVAGIYNIDTEEMVWNNRVLGFTVKGP
jgi:branched-chain amino acid transport system substrate-binding protein